MPEAVTMAVAGTAVLLAATAEVAVALSGAVTMLVALTVAVRTRVVLDTGEVPGTVGRSAGAETATVEVTAAARGSAAPPLMAGRRLAAWAAATGAATGRSRVTAMQLSRAKRAVG